MKNAQQTTPRTRCKRNQVQVTYPHQPLSGQTVEVIRPYSKEGQSYWDIVLPDGTRAFVPESWTRGEEDALLLTPRELDVRAVLALASTVSRKFISSRMRVLLLYWTKVGAASGRSGGGTPPHFS